MVTESIVPVFQVLHTNRLDLREPRLTDTADIFAIKSDPVVTEGYCTEAYTTVDRATSWISMVIEGYGRSEHIMWFITLAGQQRVIGNCTLWNLDLPSRCGELGYEFHKDFWKKGYASEAVLEVVKFGFEKMGLNRIEAVPFNHNTPSVMLLERTGFTLEGTMREKRLFKGHYHDQVIYAMLRKDWENRT